MGLWIGSGKWTIRVSRSALLFDDTNIRTKSSSSSSSHHVCMCLMYAPARQLNRNSFSSGLDLSKSSWLWGKRTGKWDHHVIHLISPALAWPYLFLIPAQALYCIVLGSALALYVRTSLSLWFFKTKDEGIKYVRTWCVCGKHDKINGHATYKLVWFCV